MYELKRANFNKKQFDEAFKEVQKNKGLNEFAVTNSGNLIAYDD